MIEVYNEDCMKVMGLIPDGTIDLLLQDTPFGVTQNKWDVKPNLRELWPHWNRICKENAAILFFATQPFAAELIMSNLKNFRYDVIWYKALGTGFLNANKMPMRNHESIIVFYRKAPVFNPQMKTGMMRAKGRKNGNSPNYGAFNPNETFNDQYFPQSVIDFSNGDRTSESDHPTQKPIDLIRYLIRTYSNEGDTVFDGYAGSGTTADACIVENRNCITCENDTEEGYYEGIKTRLSLRVQQLNAFTPPPEVKFFP